jgi:hypothetical protein
LLEIACSTTVGSPSNFTVTATKRCSMKSAFR